MTHDTIKYTGNIEFTIEEQNEEVVISQMPVTPGICNPYGTVHAGAMIWFADVTATLLAMGGTASPEDAQNFQLAIDLHTTLISNQREGVLRAEARFVKKGRRVSVVRTAVTGENGRLLAEVTTTHIPAK
jgi:uncharacterized protein (TIGR00369 family)